MEQQNTTNKTITHEAVIWAYRLFLDREPENTDVVKEKALRLRTVKELREVFINSDEFRCANSSRSRPRLSGDEPKLQIDLALSEEEMQKMLEHIQAIWQELGKTEPYWSVLTHEKFLSANLVNKTAKEEFYASGKPEVARIVEHLKRNDINISEFKTALEYGCGLGRATMWLAKRFDLVHGCDISASHLQIAEENLRGSGIRNVKFLQIKNMTDIEKLPRVDFIYSMIVLQHNPPPVIRHIIRHLLNALNPNGAALFQVPTYRQGYKFSLKKYFSNEMNKGDMEMHVLPQKYVFEIIRQAGCEVLEVLDDAWAGLADGELSNTFLVRKM